MFRSHLFAASCLLTLIHSFALAAASPEPAAAPQISTPPENNQGEGDDSDDAILVVANGAEDMPIPLPIPRVGERSWYDLVQPNIVYDAYVKSSPPGVGCFFVSNPNVEPVLDEENPSPAPDPASKKRQKPKGFGSSSGSSRSSRPSRPSGPSGFSWQVKTTREYPYVSPTFYASGSEARGQLMTFKPPFLSPARISCFRLPVNDQQQIDENAIAVLLDFYTADGRTIVTPEVGVEEEALGISVFESMTLKPTINSATGTRYMAAGKSWARTPMTLARAALVHAPPEKSSAMVCRVVRLAEGEMIGHVDFTIARQLLNPVTRTGLFLCQDTSIFET